ncbi:MAG: SPFH domain-containing protein [Alphaproteobacteria bacterium]|jgi:membrane protease subunit (stomatin/prohibitin family)|nr:SPFH domain-containing protein [Alphaproteobacteria bacterium]
MGLFSKKEGGVIDVIRCDQERYLVWKWRPTGQAVNSTKKENAIRYGSSLRVKEGEMAVFVYRKDSEQVMDFIQGPFDGTIKTENFPVLTGIVGLAFGGSSPFQAEVYFFNIQGNNQIKFAVPYFDVADPRFIDITVPVAVRGTLTFNLTDVRRFIKLNRLVDFDLDKFNDQISGTVRKVIKKVVANCPSEQGISVLQIERKIEDVSDLIQVRLAPQLSEDYGVNLKHLDISAIELDKESSDYKEFIHATKEQQIIQAEQIGRRAQIDTDVYSEASHLGVQSQHLQAHAINKQAEVLSAAANNLGGMGGSMNTDGTGGMNPIGMMMGMGVAAGMGQQMTGMMSGINNVTHQVCGASTPPPLPGSVSYMIAVNGQQYGPYNIQQMQQMAQSGQLTPQSYVWCAGMPAWEMAGNVISLKSIFPQSTPPPIPPR